MSETPPDRMPFHWRVPFRLLRRRFDTVPSLAPSRRFRGVETVSGANRAAMELAFRATMPVGGSAVGFS